MGPPVQVRRVAALFVFFSRAGFRRSGRNAAGVGFHSDRLRVGLTADGQSDGVLAGLQDGSAAASSAPSTSTASSTPGGGHLRRLARRVARVAHGRRGGPASESAEAAPRRRPERIPMYSGGGRGR